MRSTNHRAEHLRCVDVRHHREVAAEGARQPEGPSMTPRTVKLLSALHRAERQPAADGDAVPLGEIFREHDSVGLREKHQRIVDDRVIAALEVVVAEAAVPVMSIPSTSRSPCPLMFESTTASIADG